jgi:hypothetical protein
MKHGVSYKFIMKYIFMFFNIWLACFSTLTIPLISYCQKTDYKTRFRTYATTGVGISIPNDEFKSVSYDGFVTFTGLEWQSRKFHWYRVLYGVSIYGYDYKSTESGFLVHQKGSRTLLNIAFDAGLKRNISKNAVYVFTGIGLARFGTSEMTVDTTTNVIKNVPSNKFHAVLRGGIGLERQVSTRLNIYLEANYKLLIEKTLIDNIELSLVNILIGIRTPLSSSKGKK